MNAQLFQTDERIGLVLRDNRVYTPDDLMIGVWRNAYPGVDVPGELRKMQAWCLSNQRKRKTLRGVAAFINRWLANARPCTLTHGGARSTRSRSIEEDLNDHSWAD